MHWRRKHSQWRCHFHLIENFAHRCRYTYIYIAYTITKTIQWQLRKATIGCRLSSVAFIECIVSVFTSAIFSSLVFRNLYRKWTQYFHLFTLLPLLLLGCCCNYDHCLWDNVSISFCRLLRLSLASSWVAVMTFGWAVLSQKGEEKILERNDNINKYRRTEFLFPSRVIKGAQ